MPQKSALTFTDINRRDFLRRWRYIWSAPEITYIHSTYWILSEAYYSTVNVVNVVPVCMCICMWMHEFDMATLSRTSGPTSALSNESQDLGFTFVYLYVYVWIQDAYTWAYSGRHLAYCQIWMFTNNVAWPPAKSIPVKNYLRKKIHI